MSTSTFHSFPHLPAELRLKIWTHTVLPRLVHITLLSRNPSQHQQNQSKSVPWTPPKTISTPVPAPLHTSHEIRRANIYTKLYITGLAPNPLSIILMHEQPYIYFNPEIDTAQVPDIRDPQRNLRDIAPAIQKLRVAVKGQLGTPLTVRGIIAPMYVNLRQLDIVSRVDEWEHWRGEGRGEKWSLDAGYVFLVTPDGKERISLLELEGGGKESLVGG